MWPGFVPLGQSVAQGPHPSPVAIAEGQRYKLCVSVISCASQGPRVTSPLLEMSGFFDANDSGCVTGEFVGLESHLDRKEAT